MPGHFSDFDLKAVNFFILLKITILRGDRNGRSGD